MSMNQIPNLMFQWPLQKVVLVGYNVQLEPVHAGHIDQLSQYFAEEEIWRFMTFAHLATRNELESWTMSAMQANELGSEMNFAIIDQTTQKAVGATSFYRVVPEHRRMELGKSWLGAPYRRTRINTAAKLLLLSHAFESVGANRVELDTDARNLRSQRALERIGATRDGLLRAHTIMRDGFIRDTVNYSFTRFEWAHVKKRLCLIPLSTRYEDGGAFEQANQ
jgi:RimJ/RimL family protein N-acetyltransferase